MLEFTGPHHAVQAAQRPVVRLQGRVLRDPLQGLKWQDLTGPHLDGGVGPVLCGDVSRVLTCGKNQQVLW